MALFESLFRLIPVQLPAYDQLGIAMKRPGNFLGSHGVLRNLYCTSDDVYFCVSAIGNEPIRRILEGAGAAELAARVDEAVATGGDAFESFLGEADRHVAAWAAGETWETVASRLREADAVFQRVYDAAEIARDPQFAARDDLISVPDPALGPILMPGVVPKFPGFEHNVKRAAPERGQHNDEILGELLQLDKDELARLRNDDVI